MFKRFVLSLWLAVAPALPVLAEAVVAQPNRPVEVPVDAAVPAAKPSPTPSPKSSTAAEALGDDPKLERLAHDLLDKPAASAAADKSSEAKPESKPAPPPPANEKRALGPAKDDAALGPGKHSDASGTSWVLTTMTALGVVVGLILLLRAVVAKVTGRTPATSHSPVLEVLSRTSVAPKNHVLLLRLGQRILVVGDSAAGLATLANIDDPEEVASLLQAVTASKSDSASRGFTETLDGFDGQYDEHDRPAAEGRDSGEHRVDRTRDGIAGLTARLRAMATGKGGS